MRMNMSRMYRNDDSATLRDRRQVVAVMLGSGHGEEIQREGERIPTEKEKQYDDFSRLLNHLEHLRNGRRKLRLRVYVSLDREAFSHFGRPPYRLKYSLAHGFCSRSMKERFGRYVPKQSTNESTDQSNKYKIASQSEGNPLSYIDEHPLHRDN